MVRRQLDTLRRLASAALDVMENATRRARSERADPMADVMVIETTLRLSGKVDWALRLIEALRAKLAGDLQRLQRGEAPEDVFATEAAADPRPTRAERVRGEKTERRDRPDRERYDRLPRGFGDDDFAEILKRPTDEIIALICQALGLSPDWPGLAEEAWEREEAAHPPPLDQDSDRPVAEPSRPSIRFC